MPARQAKPNGGAEHGTSAASSRPNHSTSMAEIPTDDDLQQAQDPMNTIDHIHTQVGPVADAEENFLSPDEVIQGKSTSDNDEENDSAREDATNGQWQLALSWREPELEALAKATAATPERLQENKPNAGDCLHELDGERARRRSPETT
ncbi:hypothetical protein HPB52_012959 [Rhipicephalus sanguineus]|uniref:Uncharacterized protein n=1 Tax=Rhipicephalus sanguineus TaxID=34632 RepID=A0A9D4SNI1_RHISA|nr:hypothetical protein HPB52_012959 [Rhipicephalus sanguineus]